MVAKGRIRKANNRDEPVDVETTCVTPSSSIKMLRRDIYKELRLRGYNYRYIYTRVAALNE